MTETWVPLLVPREDYAELAALVLERTTQRGRELVPMVTMVANSARVSTRSPNADATAALEDHQAWSLDDLRRFASSSVTTAQRWTRAMDVCADHVGEFLSTRQVAEESGLTINEWRDAPRKITRHIASNYPAAPGWPLVVSSAHNVGEHDSQAYWAMAPEQAERWAQIRKEQSA